jgi:anti-sigma regulatory factor (Ser/Thr protein kinase)
MSREVDNPGEVRARLAAEAQSVAQARRLVRNVLRGSTAEVQRVHDALLVASELVSNAISHGSRQGDEIDVQFTLVGSTLLLRVVDPARADAVPHLPPRDPARAGGRGIEIIGRLGRWSERVVDGRRAVQAELDL